MNSNIDVLKELEVKNKEIYINKLGIDLDTNLENLLITINNMMSLFAMEVTNKVLEIKNDVTSSEEIKEKVVAFQEVIKNELINLMNKRTESLKEKIQYLDGVDYKEVLNNEKANVINKIGEFFKKHIISLFDELKNDLSLFDQGRLDDYLNILYYEKLITKLNDAIYNMDIILYNNYGESYQKFLDLNAKTLK